jgi:hypothetical protein
VFRRGCSRETGRELEGALALIRGEARDVHERLDVVSGRVGDDAAAVGVADQDDGALDRLEDAGDELRITRDAAESVRRRDHRVALVLEAADHVVPTRGLSEGAVHEDDGGLGSILRVFAHAFLLGRGATSRAIPPRPAV